MSISIRPATLADEAAISHICLLTGNAGKSAESVYTIPDLIGRVYAVPYIHMKNAFAYVLVTTSPEPSIASKEASTSATNEPAPSDAPADVSAPIVPAAQHTDAQPAATSSDAPVERVIGYIIGTTDTRAYAAEALRDWWPLQRAKYPVEETPGNADDKRLMGLFVKPDVYPEAITEKVPAHMHINVLPESQGTGWGRRMLNTAVNHVRDAGGKAIFLGIDPRNDNARRFYKHVGFKHEPSEHGENYILSFDDWVAPKAA